MTQTKRSQLQSVDTATASRLYRLVQFLQSGWRAYAVLALILAVAYAVMALRGFTLGFYSDMVAYQYHFELRGVVGGMNWLVTEYWQRHLLGGWLAAPLHVLAPDRYDLWYALTLGIHFMVGPVIFLLVDTLQCGQRRWLGYAVTLLFLFDTLQTPSNIEFPTGWDHRIFLIFALLSLWSYILFVRSKRLQFGWYILSVLTYMLAIMTYEQSFFFILLHPLIAFVEDRRTGEFSLKSRYLWLIVRDSILQVCFLAIYVYLLRILFWGANYGMSLSLTHIASQTVDGLLVVFNPVDFWGRLVYALSISQWWLVALLSLLIGAVFQVWIPRAGDDAQRTGWTPVWLIGFGALMAFLAVFNSSPSTMPFALHPRLLFAGSLGSGFVLLGILAWIIDLNRRLGSVVFSVAMALVLAAGISFFYEHQAIHLERGEVSERAYQAIYDAIPEFAPGAAPYILLIADRDAEDELYLHARDINFPRVFALHYNIEDFAADAVLFDDDGRRNLAQIRLTQDGIVSPLKPREVIGYDRVVILEYDSRQNLVSIIERLPDEVLSRGNFELQADIRVETNWSLLP